MLFYFAFFFFNDTATTEIYTLSLHDALPISQKLVLEPGEWEVGALVAHIPNKFYNIVAGGELIDRKSTRLNSSHVKRSRMPSSA